MQDRCHLVHSFSAMTELSANDQGVTVGVGRGGEGRRTTEKSPHHAHSPPPEPHSWAASLWSPMVRRLGCTTHRLARNARWNDEENNNMLIIIIIFSPPLPAHVFQTTQTRWCTHTHTHTKQADRKWGLTSKSRQTVYVAEMQKPRSEECAVMHSWVKVVQHACLRFGACSVTTTWRPLREENAKTFCPITEERTGDREREKVLELGGERGGVSRRDGRVHAAWFHRRLRSPPLTSRANHRQLRC